MRNNRIQNQVTAGRWTQPFSILICTLCWIVTFFILPDLTQLVKGVSIWPECIHTWMPSWLDRFISYLLYATIGYFLIELNNRFGIIRMRASVQTSLYFLLVTVCPETHLLYAGDLAALACLFSIYFLFQSYQQNHSSGNLFHSFFFIGLGSLVFPQLTFLSLLWLIGAYRFQSLHPRSFFAALLGWLLPYWLLFGHAFFYKDMELFYQPFRELTTFGKAFDMSVLQPWEWATLGYLLVLFLVSTIHCFVAGFEDKIRTRAYLHFFIDLTFFLFLAIAVQPQLCNDILPLLMISGSILIGHLFVLTNSRSSNVFFIAAMVALVFLFGFNLWTLL